jgi:hypothetical protein
MQIAKGFITITPDNKQFRYDITPAEAMVLHKLHFKNSNGSPLSDLVITGEATTVETPFRRGEPAWVNPITGTVTPAVNDVLEKSHKRTNKEEAERLRRKYTGMVKSGNATVSVFLAVFGDVAMPKLPATFSEIVEVLGETVVTGDEREKSGKKKVEQSTTETV